MHPFLNGVDVGFDAGRRVRGHQRSGMLDLFLPDQRERTRHSQHGHPDDQRRQPWHQRGGQSQDQGSDQCRTAVEGQNPGTNDQASTDTDTLTLR